MDFWDQVYELRKNGLIPRVWNRHDLRLHLARPSGDYPVSEIDSILAELSVGLNTNWIGAYVKNGREPRAWRVGPPLSGDYTLVADPDDSREAQDGQMASARMRVEGRVAV